LFWSVDITSYEAASAIVIATTISVTPSVTTKTIKNTYTNTTTMASGSCLCGNVSIEYKGEPALKVNLLLPFSPFLSPSQAANHKQNRRSATAPTAKRSAAAPSASTTSSLAKAFPSPATPKPTPKPLILARRLLLISVVIVDLLFSEMERISRV
jgi:hypothetical protein